MWTVHTQMIRKPHAHVTHSQPVELLLRVSHLLCILLAPSAMFPHLVSSKL